MPLLNKLGWIIDKSRSGKARTCNINPPNNLSKPASVEPFPGLYAETNKKEVDVKSTFATFWRWDDAVGKVTWWLAWTGEGGGQAH